MSGMQTDLVIQISTSALAPGKSVANAKKTEESRLIEELRQCLQPGVEIALTFPSYKAITSILWLTELQLDHSFRAGVRLLGVSALTGDQHSGSEVERDELPGRIGREHSSSTIVT